VRVMKDLKQVLERRGQELKDLKKTSEENEQPLLDRLQALWGKEQAQETTERGPEMTDQEIEDLEIALKEMKQRQEKKKQEVESIMISLKGCKAALEKKQPMEKRQRSDQM